MTPLLAMFICLLGALFVCRRRCLFARIRRCALPGMVSSRYPHPQNSFDRIGAQVLRKLRGSLKHTYPCALLDCPLAQRLKDPSPRDTELYVVSWFVFGLVISIAICLFYRSVSAVHWLAYPLEALIYLLALLRVAEIIVRTTPINFSNVISRQRSLVLVAINYVELMVWFGLIYALNYQCLVDQSLGGDRSAPAGPITAFYFSIVTQLTIGYGDVYAKGWLRTIAALQGLVGALFVIVVLGRAVSAPQKATDDQ
jgi:hypothetical protein